MFCFRRKRLGRTNKRAVQNCADLVLRLRRDSRRVSAALGQWLLCGFVTSDPATPQVAHVCQKKGFFLRKNGEFPKTHLYFHFQMNYKRISHRGREMILTSTLYGDEKYFRFKSKSKSKKRIRLFRLFRRVLMLRL